MSKKQYNDGYFLDLYENLNLNPISKIELNPIENISNNDNYKNLFTPALPIYIWKGNFIKIERIDSNYINLIENESNLFEIGTDSLGNKLYSNKKAINFIEITNSSEPSINKLNYSVITQQIDLYSYLHYSTDYTKGKVTVDIKIGLEKKPCDDKTKNGIIDILKYSCEDKDLDLGNTYQQLDEAILARNNTKIVNNNVYLYSRTYISPPKEYKYYHNLHKIKKFAHKKSKTNSVLYDIAIFVNICCNYRNNFQIFNPLGAIGIYLLIFFNTIILMICPVIKISLISIAINNYNKYNNNIFSHMNHGIKNYYKKYPWFIQYDIAILIFEFILLIPSLILLFNSLCRILGFYGKKAIDNISEKIKKREERQQRIKKYKEEIKELENNPDIPISRINKKRLEFFKERFYDALTCPISLDIFKEPVIVSSGHTYEKEYIMKIINDNGNDPLTRKPLNKKYVIDNYLVDKLNKIFNSGKNFNENIFNKMIELLKCPLSKKFFHEPYLASIGYKGMTYERSYIERHIFSKKKDPTFNENIQGELIKNYVIKDMVDALIEMNQKSKDYSIEIRNEIQEKYNNNLISDDKLKNDKNIVNIKNNNDLIDNNEINISERNNK